MLREALAKEAKQERLISSPDGST